MPQRHRSDATPLRAAWSAFALAAMLVTLAGCGFSPLYGGERRTIQEDAFSAINIVPIRERHGQILHNHLSTALNPGGAPAHPLYNLEVNTRLTTTRLGIRIDETATRANLVLAANFRLRDRETNRILFSGASSSTNSYNILESRFATIAAERDATERAARVLSDTIRTRLGIYFADGATAQSTP